MGDDEALAKFRQAVCHTIADQRLQLSGTRNVGGEVGCRTDRRPCIATRMKRFALALLTFACTEPTRLPVDTGPREDAGPKDAADGGDAGDTGDAGADAGTNDSGAEDTGVIPTGICEDRPCLTTIGNDADWSFVSGPAGTTLPMVLFSKLKLGMTPEVNALGAVVVVVAATALGLAALLLARVDARRGGG